MGTGVAIVLRVCLTMAVSYLLDVPGLKLAGALALIVIAIKLIVKRGERAKINGTSRADGNGSAKLGDGLWTAIGIIIIAYPALSLDSVVALAAVAQGHVIFLTLGLLASTPLLVYGSVFVTGILDRYPFLIPAGGALLGWIAGEMGIADPVISNWVSTQAPALTVVMPLLGAVFVLLESRIVEQKHKNDRGYWRPAEPSIRRISPTTEALTGVEPPRKHFTVTRPSRPSVSREHRFGSRPARGAWSRRCSTGRSVFWCKACLEVTRSRCRAALNRAKVRRNRLPAPRSSWSAVVSWSSESSYAR